MNISIHVVEHSYDSPYLQIPTDTISKKTATERRRRSLLRKNRFIFWSTNAINCDLFSFTRQSKMFTMPSKNDFLLRERATRRRLLLLSSFLVFFACCIRGPDISFIPQANAEQLCGRHLVDALYYLCGSAGVHTTIIKATTNGVKQPESITVMCCERSCTTEQLEQYCGQPSQSAEERRRQHLMHLAALLSPQNTRRKWLRRQSRKSSNIKPAVHSTTTKASRTKNQHSADDSQNENSPITRVTRYAKHSMQRQHLIERSRRWRQRQAKNSNFPEDTANDSTSPFITRLLKYKTDDTEI